MTGLRFSSIAIKEKLLGVIVLTAGAALLLAGTALVSDFFFLQQRMIRLDAVTAADMVGFNSASALLFHDSKSAEATLTALRVRSRYRAAAIYDKNGALFAQFFQTGAPREFPPRLEADGVRFTGRRLLVFAPILWARERVGTVYLSVSLQDLYAGVGFFVLAALVILLLCLVAAYGIGLRLQRLISQPILDLAGTVRAISQTKDYSLRVHEGGEDELGLLAAAFNGMLSQIQSRDASLQEARANLERRVAERTAELARQTRHLDVMNKELEAFTAAVSHDLRAPLRGIDGFSKYLQDNYSAALDVQGQDYLQRVRAGTQRMGHLIDKLLDLSRLSRAELRLESVDMGALARRIAERLQQAEPGRQVRWVIAPDLWVRGDAQLLELALENLLSNAWKFTGHKSPARIEVGLTRQEGQTAYFVSDDGAGFDMAYANKLFGAFQRLHTQKEFPGTGVGLATVQRIIGRHGGRIWAQAEVGKGSTFYFTLP